MQTAQRPVFYLPVRPYTPIDALNRRAAAVGSPRYAAGASTADYNGHAVRVWWNDFRRYYIAEYQWAGRNVLARGTFEDCLRAALSEYDRGALGASVMVAPRPDDAEALAACEAHPRLVPGRVPENSEWLTWRHSAAAQSVRDYANPGRACLIFDWDLMQAADSEGAYLAALKAKYGNPYR